MASTLHSQPKVQFYRRPLPKTCIDFASEEGRILFKEALNNGHMTCYFKLSAQFRTQDEPAYCGLTSLVMALNVLEIDPGRVWKGPWRWYHENMLDCCISLDVVKEKGINLEQFVCVAKCNNLAVEHISGMQFESVDKLRTLIKEKVQIDNEVMIVSYSRSIFNQTGTGHFSPIAGYHEDRDSVLILDTARFKYPPHWVSLSLLLEAMQTQDIETGQPRGMVILSRTNAYVGTLLYKLSCSFVISTERGTLPPEIWHFSDSWNLSLNESSESEIMPDINTVLNQFVQTVLDCLNKTPLLCLVMQYNSSSQCDSLCCNISCRNVSADEEKEIQSIYVNLIQSLESLTTFQMIKKIVSLLPKFDRVQLMKLIECSEIACSEKDVSDSPNKDVCRTTPCHRRHKVKVNDAENLLTITPENIMTILFLLWPNDNAGCGQNKKGFINRWIEEDLQGKSKIIVRQEVVSLHFKMVEVLNYHQTDRQKWFSVKKCFT